MLCGEAQCSNGSNPTARLFPQHPAAYGVALAGSRFVVRASWLVGRARLLLHVLPPLGTARAPARHDLFGIEQASPESARRSGCRVRAARLRRETSRGMGIARTARG